MNKKSVSLLTAFIMIANLVLAAIPKEIYAQENLSDEISTDINVDNEILEESNKENTEINEGQIEEESEKEVEENIEESTTSFILKKDQSYEITNNNEDSITIYMDRYYKTEVVFYNSNGEVQRSYDDYTDDIYMDQGEYIKIKPVESDITYTVNTNQYENIQIKEIEQDPITYITLKKDLDYEIKNNNDLDAFIDNIYITMQIVKYKEDGTYEYIGNIIGGIEINSNAITHVRSKESDITGYIATDLYKNLEIKELDFPIFEIVTLENGKNYSIKNSWDNKISSFFDTNGNLSYDIVTYEENGSIYIYNYSYDNRSMYQKFLPKNTSIITAKDNIDVYIPYTLKEYIEIKECETPAFYNITMKHNESYEIINTTDEQIYKIDNKNNLYSRYDTIRFKEDGTYEYIVNTSREMELEKKERVLIQRVDEYEMDLELLLPYKYIKDGKVVVNKLDYDIANEINLYPKIKVNLTKELSIPIDIEEKLEVEDSLNNYEVKIYNETKNKEITDISIKNNTIYLQINEANPNDKLSITVKDRYGEYINTTNSFNLDSEKNATVDVKMIQKGSININITKNTESSPTTRVLLFNNKGEVIDTISTTSTEKISTSILDSGKYTIMIFKADGDLWRLDTLEDFDERGILENQDYIKYEVEVKEGLINVISPKSIPTMDLNRLSFFELEKTSFLSNTQSVNQGGLLELRLEYKFKDKYTTSNITDKNIKIELPEEVSLIENSILLDNKKINYNHENDNTITIPIDKMSGVIKLNVRPMESKKVTFKSEALFIYEDKYINEIIGTAVVDINYITINGASETSTKLLKVHGIAKSNSDIEIYDGDVKLGNTKSLSSGIWNTEVELNKPYNGSTHKLYAKSVSDDKKSNTIEVKYTESAPVIKSVIMTHNDQRIDLTESMNTGVKPIVTFAPNTPYTFEIKVENGDSLKELYVISSKNNEELSLKATYDKEKDLWIASGFFNPSNTSYVPGDFSIAYQYKESIKNYLEVDYESAIKKEDISDELKNATVETIIETENHQKYEITLDDEEKSNITLESKTTTIPQDINKNNIEDKGFIEIDEDIWVSYSKLNIDMVSIINFKEGTFFYTSISEPPKIAGIAGGLTAFLAGYDYQTSINRYNNLKQAYPQYKDEIERLEGISDFRFFITMIDASGILDTSPTLKALAWTGDKVLGLVETIFDGLLTLKICQSGSVSNIIDPSGYVYEGVESNKLPGVKTTAYYKNEETGEAVLWNASEYGQQNPLITDHQGRYAWNVPEGLWQVKYEKEGYETVYSDWLPVPPPQTEVNIGLISKEEPKIEIFNMYSDRAEITFNKYMDTSTIDTNSIKLLNSKGTELPITIEPVNPEKSSDGKMLARKFILKTNSETDSNYTIKISKEVTTYAGVNPSEEISKTITYKNMPTKIEVKEEYTVNYKENLQIPISIDNKTNATDFYLIAKSNMIDIVKVNNERINFDKNGNANLSISGLLPGETTINLSIEGTDITSRIKINIKLDGQINSKPVINAEDKTITLGDKINLLENVTATDAEDGIISEKVKVSNSTLNINKPGAYTVEYRVEDSNGGIGTKTINVKVKNVFIDFSVNNINSKSTKITGKGTKGATVEAYVGTKKIGKATVNTSGNYTITIPAQKGNTSIVVKINKNGYAESKKTIKVINISSGAKKTLTTDIYKYDAGKGKYLTYINGKGYSQYIYLNKSGKYAFTPSSWMSAAGLTLTMPTSSNGYTMTIDNNYIGLYNDANNLLNKIKSNSISAKEIELDLNMLEIKAQAISEGNYRSVQSKAAPKKTLTNDIYKYDVGKGKYTTYINGKGYSQYIYLNKSGKYAFTPSSWMVAAGLTVTMPTSSNGYTMKINNPYITKYNNAVKEIRTYID